VTERIVVRAACALAALLSTAGLGHAQGTPQRSVWDGIYTAAQADRGKAVYASHCSKCHGDDLGGKDEVPELSGAHFMADWQSQSLADLVQRIRSTMPLDNPGTLGGASTTDVVAYLLQQNGAPAGSAELPNDSSMQSIIRIDEEPAPALKPTANAPRSIPSTPLTGLLGVWRWSVACVSGAPDLNF
jgi:quinoprotein glucose dehydrogenase